jgi:uroporphyrinogen-III decarboxylase
MKIAREILQEGFTRFIQAANGFTDRIPISAQLPEHARWLCKINAQNFYTQPLPFVKAMLAVHQYYNLDAIYLFYDIYNIEAEALGQTIIYRADSMPDIDSTQPLLKEKKDLTKLVLPTPGESGRMPFVIDICRLFTDYTGLPALTGICAPFSLAVGIRGYSAIIKDLRRDQSFAHELLRMLTTEVLIPWAKKLKAACGDKVIIFAADAWASPPNIDMRIQEEFVVPYSKLLFDTAGVPPLGQWGQSYVPDPERFIESQLAMGMPGVIALDPDAENLGIMRFKDISRKKGVPLTLGLSSQLLRDGPPEKIRRRVIDYLNIGAPGGRCLFFLNYVPADTPPGHIMTVVNSVREGEGQFKKDRSERTGLPQIPFCEYLKNIGIKHQEDFYNH